MTPLQQKIESLCLFKNEPLTYSWLAKKLGVSENDIYTSVGDMMGFYTDRGITLVRADDSVALMTAASSAELLNELTKAKEERELSKQAMETLSIVAYKGRITKPELDYIRGVNSVFILRNLLIRGLIEKKQNLLDKRSPFYVPTHDLYSFLGIESKQDLPEFEAVGKKLTELEEHYIDDIVEVKEPIIVNGDDTNDEDIQ